MQNADDAGATRVAFLLDARMHGTKSLFGPKMAMWQGPALLCYNDSMFSPSDFTAISRIGQDSKVDRPAATGRFGLGFNAVYNWTDLPGFVSGEHLVLFDPHAKYVPGVSAASPGLKIRFTGPNATANLQLADQFPDAVAPFLHFGYVQLTSFHNARQVKDAEARREYLQASTLLSGMVPINAEHGPTND